MDFTPYTYQDYEEQVKRIRETKMGGLGPARVGSEEWKEKVKMQVKVNLYDKKVRENNTQQYIKQIVS